ncbi:zinc finger protein [Trichinella spiralis]|uniref:zinc finger protein n=1 Tax=Trichinella spiralis TaxID=6334 RepID=UPI0001EFD4DD|nr:zinc finger protein [Trichinella spiralis]
MGMNVRELRVVFYNINLYRNYYFDHHTPRLFSVNCIPSMKTKRNKIHPWERICPHPTVAIGSVKLLAERFPTSTACELTCTACTVLSSSDAWRTIFPHRRQAGREARTVPPAEVALGIRAKILQHLQQGGYFLRTHMLKMHGIVIDENRTVIGSINTTTVENGGSAETSKSFVCRVCDRHFPGSHDLKLHYEEEHQRRNVPPPASEASSKIRNLTWIGRSAAATAPSILIPQLTNPPTADIVIVGPVTVLVALTSKQDPQDVVEEDWSHLLSLMACECTIHSPNPSEKIVGSYAFQYKNRVSG